MCRQRKGYFRVLEVVLHCVITMRTTYFFLSALLNHRPISAAL